MKTRPFLSHRRSDRNRVIELKKVLSLYGVGGWRDLDDLHLGELGQPGFERAIQDVTGGFLWYGTRRILDSWYVNNVELPAAVDRKRHDPEYPLVPLFVTTGASEAKTALSGELAVDDLKLFFEANGLVRGRPRPERFHSDVARGYVRAAVRWLDKSAYSVGATALAEPAGYQDFTLDWRSVLDPDARELSPGAGQVLVDALRNLRDAVRPTAAFPELTLDLDLPLPLAVLIGYEWRVASRLRLTVRQRRRSTTVLVAGDGRVTRDWPSWEEELLGGSGPCVVAVATTIQPLEQSLAVYAREVGAARTMELHAPGELSAADIRGLARHAADQLREVNAGGFEKHLLLAGPVALAVLIGAGSNANGPTLMPFWDGVRYVSPVPIGG